MYDSINDQIASRALVKNGEALEPLGGGYAIIQPTDGYRFGTDAAELARTAGGEALCGKSVFDLCSGCGIVGLALAAEYGARVSGAEIDARLCDMSNRSAAANGVDARFYNVDLRGDDVFEIAGRRAFDFAVCNPPFFKADSKPCLVAPTANSELTIDFERIAFVASELLKTGGKFLFVHTLSRLDEIVCTCTARGLRVKKLTINKNRKTFFAVCRKGAKAGMRVEVL